MLLVEIFGNPDQEDLESLPIYTYGVARDRMLKAARNLNVPVTIEKQIRDARIAVTLKHHYRDNPKSISDAEELGLPIYVLRSNTINRMEHLLKDIFNLKNGTLSKSDEKALQQTQGAIQAVLSGERWVELPPASSIHSQAPTPNGNPGEIGFSFFWQRS